MPDWRAPDISILAPVSVAAAPSLPHAASSFLCLSVTSISSKSSSSNLIAAGKCGDVEMCRGRARGKWKLLVVVVHATVVVAPSASTTVYICETDERQTGVDTRHEESFIGATLSTSVVTTDYGACNGV